jgi:hypothetical protein
MHHEMAHLAAAHPNEKSHGEQGRTRRRDYKYEE